ncbi:hypothetical protein [Bythopirellula goksoeyrii]|uniref:Uncharacterized protein n=1 Tax=Bythopirellula goksoeyrii TaxID=1400387 RepID=A0A5B9QJB3_9BACT|nr:hypothetical protein [Bythopirellula goksoeyrii]QEG37126.1 hypothetical protein Pr1d_44660 [Bythopirellula goksoeyrii]
MHTGNCRNCARLVAAYGYDSKSLEVGGAKSAQGKRKRATASLRAALGSNETNNQKAPTGRH